MRKVFYKEYAFIIAMFTNSLAINLLNKSSFGISTLSSLPLVLSEIIPNASLGTMTTIVQTILLISLIIITRQPKLSYLFSFLVAYVYGLLVDFFAIITNIFPNFFILRIIYFIIGWLILSFGIALFIKSSMPLMPNDAVIKDLSIYFKVKVKKVKTTADLIFVVSALILSLIFLRRLEGVGIGTVIMAMSVR